MPNEAPYGHGCPPEPVAGKSSKYRTFGPEKREAGGWAVRPGDAVHQRGQQLSGLRPRPHARRGFSLRSSLLGASGFIQPTAVIMRHAKQSAPERSFTVSIFYIAPGQGFALKAAEWLCCLAPHACRLKEKPLNRISKQKVLKALI